MQCPIDGTQLVMSDRSGVEIDYCPQCRGVWLDRGELDKIIERSLQETRGGGPSWPPQNTGGGHGGSGHGGGHGGSGHGGGHDRRFGGQHGDGRGNRRGWLGQLFD